MLHAKWYHFDNVEWKYAVRAQQLKVLKWAKNNGYTFELWIFDNVYKNKYSDILKFAYKNNYVA